MKTLIAIINDIVAYVTPEKFAEYMGYDGTDNIQERVLQYLETEKISTPKKLSCWIKETFGDFFVTDIMKEFPNIQWDSQSSTKSKIEAWFEFRELELIKPQARPLELADIITELANTIYSTPENFDAEDLLLSPLVLLMRYIIYFYSPELFKNSEINSPEKNNNDRIDGPNLSKILIDSNFTEICALIGYDKPLPCEPYNAVCENTITLSNERIKKIIERISYFISETSVKYSDKDNKSISNYIIELLELWQPNQYQGIIPKGAVIAETHMTGFGSQAICYDELNDNLTIKGFRTNLATGDSLLLAPTKKQEFIASNLEPLPKEAAWITPSPNEYNWPNEIKGAEFLKERIAMKKRPSIKKIKRNKVFISYSQKDRRWLDHVQTHLKVVENLGVSINYWDDTKITSGMLWKEEIENALSAAKAAILLVSTNFLASEFISTVELPSLLKSAKTDGAIIIPVILMPSMYEDHELSAFHAINDPKKPIAMLELGEQEEIFVKLAKRIKALMDEE